MKSSASSKKTKPKRAERVVRKTLADGSIREYRYPAHVPSTRPKHKSRTLGALIDAWQRSPEWIRLAKNTQRSRIHYLRPLAGMLQKPLDQVERRHIIAIRNEIASGGYDGRQGPSPAAANEFVVTVAAMFASATSVIASSVATRQSSTHRDASLHS
jgi:hypothetical protein